MLNYLCAIGTSLGDRIHYIDAALAAFKKLIGPVVKISPVFETAPWGAAQELFLNAVWHGQSALSPPEVMQRLLEIERSLGRQRLVRWGDRTVDLDLLYAWDEKGTPVVMESQTLTLPHPRILERDFVLYPAALVAPDLKDPSTGQRLQDECLQRGYQLPHVVPSPSAWSVS